MKLFKTYDKYDKLRIVENYLRITGCKVTLFIYNKDEKVREYGELYLKNFNEIDKELSPTDYYYDKKMIMVFYYITRERSNNLFEILEVIDDISLKDIKFMEKETKDWSK